jgi:hypothetical protein
MWNDYFSYLDYLELRRRVEKHLAKAHVLALHISVFVVAVLYVLMANNRFFNPGEYPGYFTSPSLASFMAGWSLLLLAHGLLTFRRSAASENAREKAIETEMRQRLEKQDTYLVEDERDLFRLHGLLNEDIKSRASPAVVLTVFTAINGLMWFVWALDSGGRDPFAWQMTPLLALAFMPLLFAVMNRRSKHDQELMHQLSENEQAAGKRKRRTSEQERAVRLTDDGELVDFPNGEMDAPVKPKRAGRS